MTTVFVIYDSRGGLVEQLAEAVAAGVREVGGVSVRSLRMDEADPAELLRCDAPIVGSPN